MKIKGFRDRWRKARTWRTCPACGGDGTEIDFRTFRSKPCYLCEGDGEVRFTWYVALRFALDVPTILMRQNAALEEQKAQERRRHGE